MLSVLSLKHVAEALVAASRHTLSLSRIFRAPLSSLTCVCVRAFVFGNVYSNGILGMEALCTHMLEMMSLISETLMSMTGLEYAVFDNGSA